MGGELTFSATVINTGNITLTGSTLVGLVAPSVAIGDTFTIITTTGGNVIGQFAQGTTVFIDGKKFNVNDGGRNKNRNIRTITDKQLRWLASFPELRELDLSNTKVSDAGLAHPPRDHRRVERGAVVAGVALHAVARDGGDDAVRAHPADAPVPCFGDVERPVPPHRNACDVMEPGIESAAAVAADAAARGLADGAMVAAFNDRGRYVARLQVSPRARAWSASSARVVRSRGRARWPGPNRARAGIAASPASRRSIPCRARRSAASSWFPSPTDDALRPR